MTSDRHGGFSMEICSRRKLAAEEALAAAPEDFECARALASARDHLGSAYRSENRIEEALAEHLAAAEMFEALAARDGDDVSLRRDLWSSRFSAGLAYGRQELPDEAAGEFLACKRIMEPLTELFPDQRSCLFDLAVTRDCLAGQYELQQKWEEALSEYEANRCMLQDMVARDPDYPTAQHALARAHTDCGHMYEQLGRVEEALTEYLASRRIRDALAAKDPKLGPAFVFFDVGRVYEAQGRLADALGEYAACAQMLESRVVGGEDDPYRRHNLANAHLSIGRVRLSMFRADRQPTDLDASDLSHSAAIALLEDLLVEPVETFWILDLAEAWAGLGEVYLERGLAGEEIRRTIDIVRQLRGSCLDEESDQAGSVQGALRRAIETFRHGLSRS